MVELCHGVQHPMRGLFLRDYMSSVVKDKLPDVGNEYEAAGGSFRDSIEFVLQNFGEMNKLWVRMQHQGAVKDKARREDERRNLRQLVGTNLVRLSNLNGVDLAVYKELVLPRVLEQIVNCKDVIAQEYLMDSIIQVFPDDFHHNTLELFLSTCLQLQDGVNCKDIIIRLMRRLADYIKDKGTSESVQPDMEVFAVFLKYTSKVIEASAKMPLVDVLQLQVALVNFTSTCYPSSVSNIDHVLGFSVEVLKKAGLGKLEHKATAHVTQLLSQPLDALKIAIFDLHHYGALMEFLTAANRKSVAVSIVQAMVKGQVGLDAPDKVEALFQYIGPLIKDEGEPKPVADDERFEFDREQHSVARLFHLIYSEDTDVQFKLFSLSRKYFGQGGTQRIEYTLPPVVYRALELAKRVLEREQRGEEVQFSARKVFTFVQETIAPLTTHFPELAMRLFLHAASMADKLKFEAYAYDNFAHAYEVYEEQISDSKAQYNAITFIVATLTQMTVFGYDNYDTLAGKATQHCAKLLKKPDQCRAIYQAAHLFWPGDDATPGHRAGARTIACLQRALKIANGCVGQQFHLFVEILNKILFFYDRGCPDVGVKYVRGLINLINEHMPSLDSSESSLAVKQHYQNTLLHIRNKQAIDGDIGKRYLAIDRPDESEDPAPAQ
jgi:vacuolar protein sorting-associated protein 35